MSEPIPGPSGNSFVIIAGASRALRAAGVSSGEIEQFRSEATSGDYTHLLTVCKRWGVRFPATEEE